MCKYILKNGKQCKKAIGKDLCHIHIAKQVQQAQKAQEVKDACLIITLHHDLRSAQQKIDILTKISKTQSDLINTNKKIYDELHEQHIKNIDEHNVLLTLANKMNQQCTNAKNEIKNLNTSLRRQSQTIEKTVKDLRSKNNVINDLLLETHNLQAMRSDYDKYQVIKEFELEKKKLIDSGIDIYNYYDNDFHTKRFNRNKYAHLIEC